MRHDWGLCTSRGHWVARQGADAQRAVPPPLPLANSPRAALPRDSCGEPLRGSWALPGTTVMVTRRILLPACLLPAIPLFPLPLPMGASTGGRSCLGPQQSPAPRQLLPAAHGWSGALGLPSCLHQWGQQQGVGSSFRHLLPGQRGSRYRRRKPIRCRHCPRLSLAPCAAATPRYIPFICLIGCMAL